MLVNDNGNDHKHTWNVLMASTPSRRVTIKQVAQEAGVSAQTVSRVINERPDVAPETRQRVLEIIERLGYQPNVLARSLSQQRSYSLGVVTAGLMYIGPSRTLNGITARAEALGYTLVLKELRTFGGYDVGPILDDLRSRQVDGIIWAVPEMEDNRRGFQERLDSLDVPIVFLTQHSREGWHIVAVDNCLGARLATAHLVELGHEHIGHITGPLVWWEARERKRGWEEGLVEAGIMPSEKLWVEGDWSAKGGWQAMARLLNQAPDITAVFVANDQMALGALHYLHEQGITVPDDIAMVGFDAIPEAAHFWPPMSTIRHDQHELGCRAVETVVQLIEAQQRGEVIEPKTQVLQPQLIIRESSQPRQVIHSQTPQF
ncbi:MAG: LacI family transcriptional regulator [Caldilineae bacterium]|nr:MAG: LacI family transcriptional regulator [Caldilineae bacterium]